MDGRSTFGAEPSQLRHLLSMGHQRNPERAKLAGITDRLVDVPGTRIGRYKLLRISAEGGMGIVYVAEQEHPFRRLVALKVIKPGMDSRSVIRRFEAERQALALLDHPNIAQVYDAGTTEMGRPYFVMELVKGLPITEYCDRHKLTIEDRLRLFQQVCHGLQHAHQKGIIHRDIKPSNVLVSAEDGEAVPKIIDFGVAKAVSQPLTERTLVTEDSRLLGTPEYMSPEQADMANEDIDTRSDIYSLGALLYVLLAGILPYDSTTFRQGGIEHIRKMIREVDPKTPSTRLVKLRDEAKAVAENRSTEAATLAKRLHRELEWIPLKAMRKERSERYRSASELADDIENYLHGNPLRAAPPSHAYRLKKVVQRNRVLVASITAVLVVLATGAVVSTVFAFGQARALADNRLITDFLENDVLAMSSRARVGEATVSYVLNIASQKLEEGKFKDKPLIEASIREKLAWTYRHIGESQKAETHWLRAIEIYQQHHGEEHPDTLRATGDIGWAYEDQGRYRDMERLWTHTLHIRQRTGELKSQLGTMNALAVTLHYLGKNQEAEALFKKALRLIDSELRGQDVWLLPWFRCNLARVYTAQGRYEEAERLFVETIKTAEWPKPHHSAKFMYMSFLADNYREQGRYAEAESLFAQALEALRLLRGDKHVRTLRSTDGLDRLYIDQGRFSEAEELLGHTLKTAQNELRKEHPITLTFMNNLAVLRTRQQQYREAERLFVEVLPGRRRELGDDHPDTLQTLNDFGVLRRERGQHEEAERLLNNALDGRQHKLGPDHPACFESTHELAQVYAAQLRYEEAEPLLLQAYHGRKTKLGPTHPRTMHSLRALVSLYESWGKPEKAAQWQSQLETAEDRQREARAAPGPTPAASTNRLAAVDEILHGVANSPRTFISGLSPA